MSVDDIVTLISGVGFPIVCCLIMFWLTYKLNQSFKDEVRILTATLNENTIALTKILDKLEAIENERKNSK